MSRAFRVALSGDFLQPDGAPTFPDFDIAPLAERDGVEFAYLPRGPVIAAEDVADFDALILLQPRFAAESVHPGGRLAVVARFGVGYDNVDVPACTEADIAVVITPDGVRRPVAVAILTFMLALTGRIMVKDSLTRQGPEGYARRAEYMGQGLVGRTLGSLGVGNIGAEMFRLARPFEMRFIAHDPYADPAVAADLGIELVGIEELFRRADVLTVNCPLTPETRHIVGAGLLALMKPTAFLINTARGPIVDQAALFEVLASRRIAGAGLDVLEAEPPEPDDPILGLDNVILAPHALCWTDQCFAGNGAADIAAVFAVMSGEPPRGVVNRAVLERPGFRARLEDYRRRYGVAG